MHPSVLRRCTLVGLRKLTARERLAPPHPERPVPIGALRRCWERPGSPRACCGFGDRCVCALLSPPHRVAPRQQSLAGRPAFRAASAAAASPSGATLMWMLLRWRTPPTSDRFVVPTRSRLMVVCLFPNASGKAKGNSPGSKGSPARAETASSISTAFIGHSEFVLTVVVGHPRAEPGRDGVRAFRGDRGDKHATVLAGGTSGVLPVTVAVARRVGGAVGGGLYRSITHVPLSTGSARH